MIRAMLLGVALGLSALGLRCMVVHAQEAATNAPTASVTNEAGWARRMSWTNRPPVTDLGVMTEHTIITLQKCERRVDFAFFKVEVIPRNRRGWTNKVSFITTNSFLKLEDLAAVPDGVAILGVRQICADSTPSPVALFRIDVQRDAPDAPRASKAQILHMPVGEQKIEHLIDAVENPPGPEPPMPPGMAPTNAPSAVPLRGVSYEPLPGGTGESYSQHQARLERRAAAGERIKNER